MVFLLYHVFFDITMYVCRFFTDASYSYPRVFLTLAKKIAMDTIVMICVSNPE